MYISSKIKFFLKNMYRYNDRKRQEFTHKRYCL